MKPTPASVTSERQLQDAIVQAAMLCGWRVHHCRAARSRSGRWATHIQGHAGFPDLVLARSGVVLLLELKRIGAQMSPDQWAWARELTALRPGWRLGIGAWWMLATPADLDDVLELLATPSPTSSTTGR